MEEFRLILGFDIDGFLAKQNIINIALTRNDGFAKKLYYQSCEPYMNPYLFMNEFDEGYIITARDPELKLITKRWCNKYFPNLQLYQLDVPFYKDGESVLDWLETIAVEKSKVINYLSLDVYFEDIPYIVNRLRELCKNCAVIQYGGRLG